MSRAAERELSLVREKPAQPPLVREEPPAALVPARGGVTLVGRPAGAAVGRDRKALRGASFLVSYAAVAAPALVVPELVEGTPRYVATALLALGLSVAAAAWGRRRVRRFERVPVVEGLAGCTPGRPVRVRGTVLDGATFQNATGRPVVVAGYRGRIEAARAALPTLRARTEMHAVPFRLRLPSGETLRVTVPPVPVMLDLETSNRSGLSDPLYMRAIETTPEGVPEAAADSVRGTPAEGLRGTPADGVRDTAAEPRAAGAGRQFVCAIDDEASIAPGDLVEVLGLLDHVADREAERPGTRALPLTAVLRGTRTQPLVVRRVGLSPKA